jgi:multiple sugar transport system substrate-binding protein
VIFESREEQEAREGVRQRSCSQDENLRPYVEGALGRWFPVTNRRSQERRSGRPIRIARRSSDQFAAGTVTFEFTKNWQVHDPRQPRTCGPRR